MPKEPNQIDVDIGQRIRAMRLLKEMTQEQLAAKVGVTFQQIQKYEKGTNRVGGSRIIQIAASLDTPVSYFFGSTSMGESGVAEEAIRLMNTQDAIKLMRTYAQLTPDARRAILYMAETSLRLQKQRIGAPVARPPTTQSRAAVNRKATARRKTKKK